jgi:tetratricopeptide (TPR) repeat protein
MLFSLVQFPHGNEGLPGGIWSTLAQYYQESGLGAGEVLLTQCRVLFVYLSLILLPLPGRVQLVSPQIISRSMLDPPVTLVAVIGVMALVTLGMYLVKRRPLSGFGILFFLLNMIPEGVLVPQYAYFAYRALLPMLGIFLVVIDAIIWLLGLVRDSGRLRLVRTGFLCLAVASVGLMGMASAARAAIWGDGIRFWKETIAPFPQDLGRSESRPAGQAYVNLGTALFRKGRFAEAIESYKRSLGFLPDNAVARAGLGLAYARMGQAQEAEASLREALGLNPDLALAHQGLGDLLTGQGRLEEGRLHLQKAAHSYARTIR